MAVYDPNQQPVWNPPVDVPQPGPIPTEVQPTASGDRWALIALTASLTAIGSCIIPGFACLAPLIIGIVALVQAKNAVDPRRARTYGWIATGIGIFILLAVIVVMIGYGALFATMMNDPRFREQLR